MLHARSQFQLVGLLWLALTAVGCALSDDSRQYGAVPTREVPGETGPAPTRRVASAAGAKPGPQASAQKADATPPAEAPIMAASRRTAPANPAANPESAELVAVFEELRELGTIEPEVEQQLLSDLKKVDPALWPQLVATLKAGIAYRQEATRAKSAGDDEPREVASRELAAAPLPEDTLPESEPAPRRATKRAEPTPVDVKAVFEAEPAEIASATEISTSEPADAAVAPARFTAPRMEPNEIVAPPKSIDEQLAGLVRELETPSENSTSEAELAREMRLRMLYLLSGRREDALRPIAGLTPPEQEFWSKELYGLSALLASTGPSDPAARAAEATLHLDAATGRLREQASLVVKSLAFCTEVNSYGVYTPFESEEFSPGQEVLLYAEIENFKSERLPEGYKTALKSGYELFDARGQTVDTRDFGATEEVCRNRRRDFFIRYQFALPERLYDGKYSLKLTVEDTLGQKIGQSSLDFTIRAADAE